MNARQIVDSLLEDGEYEFSSELDSPKRGGNPGAMTFRAFYNGTKVGELCVAPSLSSPGTLYVSGVKVEPEHRRKGIATKLYRMAERHFNMKVGNDSYKTPDGAAFRSTYRSREFEDDE